MTKIKYRKDTKQLIRVNNDEEGRIFIRLLHTNLNHKKWDMKIRARGRRKGRYTNSHNDLRIQDADAFSVFIDRKRIIPKRIAIVTNSSNNTDYMFENCIDKRRLM